MNRFVDTIVVCLGKNECTAEQATTTFQLF